MGFVLFLAVNTLVGLIDDILQAKNERKKLLGFEPDTIHLQHENKEAVLEGEQLRQFLNELENKPLVQNHIAPLDDYPIHAVMLKEGEKIYEFFILPDMDVPGRMWFTPVGFGQVHFLILKSEWMMNYFKEVHFFDHEQIVKSK